jgi:dTMP kinase
MRPLLPGGFLIAVEGIDGVGKTTISALLAQYCGERGIACAYSKEPTGLKYGMQLRESAKTGRLSVEDELDLFLKDRIDHSSRSIQPALDFGAVVILDRYYWSTAAYQGARGVDPFDIVRENEKHVPVPGLVILLDTSPENGLERVRIRGDIPNEFEKVKALTKARTIFNQLHENSTNSVCIDATAPLRDVHVKAVTAVQQFVSGAIAARQLSPEGMESVLQLFGGDFRKG